MNTRIYLLSFSFGLGLGTTTMQTSDPLSVVMRLAAKGHQLEHVTIKSVLGTATEQNWQFMEWS